MTRVTTKLTLLALLALLSSCARKKLEEPVDHSSAAAPAASASSAASMADVPTRYQEAPVRALLENYVLSTIGQLSIEREQSTKVFVSKEMGRDVNWRTTVRKNFQWRDSIDGTILTNWHGYVAKAGGDAAAVDADLFAKRFVDALIQHAAGESSLPSPPPGAAAENAIPIPSLSDLATVHQAPAAGASSAKPSVVLLPSDRLLRPAAPPPAASAPGVPADHVAAADRRPAPPSGAMPQLVHGNRETAPSPQPAH